MKVGDLVRATGNRVTPDGTLGIIIETYDTPKGLWLVHWMDGDCYYGRLCHENAMEVMNETR